MPFNWTIERERQMFLLLILAANWRPSAEHWSAVASQLGGGLTPSAVSQKYYKLRNESAKANGIRPSSQHSTPTKRKASDDEDVKPTPPKRAKAVMKEELIERESLVSSNEIPLKLETKVEAIGAPSSFREQQDFWNNFQYHDGFGHGENSHTGKWGEALAQAGEY